MWRNWMAGIMVTSGLFMAINETPELFFINLAGLALVLGGGYCLGEDPR